MEVCKVFLYTFLEFLLLQLIKVKCEEDVDAWRVHEKRVGGFSCGPPQPRSFRLDEILNADELPDVHTHVFPKMTVLHRCDSHSGCCSSRSKECAPQLVDEIALTFRLLGSVGKGSLLKEKYIHVSATNHTRCSCQAAFDRPIK
ncbi:hypothetical protein RI129_008646 [Pyrocoelia pectoralis]|uniref:Platelet-derived growth factor (PDGF) family profile domain-containing protein n=1 Tax=Pyrocoelia pectoralis TaxID=417401 RepID=A0AAN7VEI0_9COLE